MFFICICCLIGAIIYACNHNQSVNYTNRNIGGPANVNMQHQVAHLQGTSAYTQETGQVIYYAMIVIIILIENTDSIIGMLVEAGERIY